MPSILIFTALLLSGAAVFARGEDAAKSGKGGEFFNSGLRGSRETKVKFFQCSTSTYSKWCGSRTRRATRRRRDSRDGRAAGRPIQLKRSNSPTSGTCIKISLIIYREYATPRASAKRGAAQQWEHAHPGSVSAALVSIIIPIVFNSTEQPNIDAATR